MSGSDGLSTAPALDHNILRQRLIQGVGAGNAARGSLSKCAKKYHEFLPFYFAAEDADAIERSKQDLVRDINLYQVEMNKVALSLLASHEDSLAIESEITKCDAEIETVRADIEMLRKDYPDAKHVRRNLEEYEALAKMACTRPSRRSLEEQIIQVKTEVQKFEASILNTRELKSLREKQFRLFMRSMLDLKESVVESAETSDFQEREEGEEDEGDE